MSNPFHTLPYEPALESIGDWGDIVAAAEFPTHILRFRNDDLLPRLGLQPQQVTDDDYIEAFGYFLGVRPFLALRYHGYQFGEYNPALGDGRGFLYGQVRSPDGNLYDLGTKGSGTTPYSRHADGRLTLKGGVREVLAAEALHRLGVNTSRCFSLIETGEKLWRGDEPSPTRSSVMVRFSKSHIRFGTFERLHYFGRPDLTAQLLNHVIEQYYPAISPHQPPEEKYAQFYAELVQRTATLVAQWMAAGFCHGVLNTDNMSITGESFDYGPYAFIPTYNPRFTAAYFDYFGRYSYGNQPSACLWNLQMLQVALKSVIDNSAMDTALATYEQHYYQAYQSLILQKLGLDISPVTVSDPTATAEIVKLTLQLLVDTQVGYHDFFWQITNQFNPSWREDASQIFADGESNAEAFGPWRQLYHHFLQFVSDYDMVAISQNLRQRNPQTALLRPEIEAIWEPIVLDDNWQPFYDLLNRLKL